MKRIPRRIFTEEFKTEAIKLVTEQQLNIAEAGQQLDVDPKSIRAWMGHAKRGELKATLGANKLTADQQRIRELERKLADQRLLVFIKAAHAKGRGIYGALKIQTELAALGIMAGINRIKHLRKLHDILCSHKKKFSVITDSKHHLPVAANLLDRQFAPLAPNRVWVTDMTYIPTEEG